MGEQVAEFDAPAADRLAGNDNPPFQQQFFDISVAEGEAMIQPDGVANDRKRKPITGELLTSQH